ncbi:unnamed protein product [Pedinophyceae sp. YPF-701]|nr:unnamed protein product [Pedinophyceae sp. YPF-701]
MSALERFRKHDFAADPRWIEYAAKIEIPGSHGDREAAMFRRKVKWWKANVDASLNVDEAVAAASASSDAYEPRSVPFAAPSSSGGAHTSNPPPDRPPRRAPDAARAAASAGIVADVKELLDVLRRSGDPPRTLIMHAAHLVLPVLAALSLIGYGGVAPVGLVAWVPILGRFAGGTAAYVWACRLALVTSALRVMPRAGRFPSVGLSMAALRPVGAWVGRAMMYIEAHHAITMLFFMLSFPPQPLIVIPPTVLGTYHLLAFLSQRASSTALYQQRIAPLSAHLARHQQHASLANALLPIVVLGLITFQIVWPLTGGFGVRLRLAGQAYALTQVLKLGYMAPDTSALNRRAWRLVDERTRSLRARFPVLQQGVDIGQRWFFSSMPAHGGPHQQ